MGLVQVDVIGVEPAQGVLAGPHNMVACEPTVVDARACRIKHFGCDEHVVTARPGSQPFPDELLGLTRRIAVAGIHQIDAGICCGIQNCQTFCLRCRVGQVVGTQHQGGNFQASAAKGAVLHGVIGC